MFGPHLFDIRYWLSSRPFPLSGRGTSILLVVFVGMIIGAAIVHIMSKQKRKVWDSGAKRIAMRAQNLLITMGLLGLILLLFSYEGIPVLGARYLLVIWGVGTLLWIVSIVHDAYVRVPMMRARNIQRGERGKYFRTS